MKKDNIILSKSFEFAVKIVKFCKHLNDNKEFVLGKQLLKSGTSIGANVNEAQAAQSQRDFISKMSIASKEARETEYWIKLIIETNVMNINNEEIEVLHENIIEISKLLTSIVKTSSERYK